MDINNLVSEESINDSGAPSRARWKAWKLTSTAGMMISLSEDWRDDESVLLGVVWNPVTPRHVLSFLAKGQFERVRKAAKSRLQ